MEQKQSSNLSATETTSKRRKNPLFIFKRSITSVNRHKWIKILNNRKLAKEATKEEEAAAGHCTSFSILRPYCRNGISVCLESGKGNNLSFYARKYIQNLLKVNMQGPYGREWHEEEKVKHKEMVSPEAHYILVREMATKLARCSLVGFVHYRFTIEEEIAVLYVYEIQLEKKVQGKGLGEFLMQLIEQIALKSHMSAVVLTVQKANASAMRFYMNKLGYIVSSISPSRVDPLLARDLNYEILCKVFDLEAEAGLAG